MNVHSISLQHFTSHDRSSLKLPKTGIVLITGENGAGKSSFIDGVSWAGWGKTIRGDVPWRGEAESTCTASLVCAGVRVARSRSRGKTALEWDADGVPEVEYETPTKAQEALARTIGSWDLWRRSHVFSAADAMHFTLASDGERKRLIESFLGNDRFEPALKQCRADLKRATDKRSAIAREIDVHRATLSATRAALAEARTSIETLAPLPPAPTLRKGRDVHQLAASIEAASSSLKAANEALRAQDRSVEHWSGELRRARHQLDQLRGNTCPTCTQRIADETRASVQGEFIKVKALADHNAQDVARARADLEATVSELSEELVALRRAHQAREAEVRAFEQEKARYAAATRAREDVDRNLARTAAEMAALRKTLTLLENDLDEVTGEAGELEQAEEVLGLKGVRAHVLGRSLKGIEDVSNAFLERLHPELRLSLKPYSEKGAADAISLVIHGRGRGTYRANSAGERRRVDIALLLGLAAVASAAQGKAPGTLFFDEVFEGLDSQGVDATCALLQELATERCVVVVSHSDEFIARLPAVQRVHVKPGGKVVV